MVTVGVTTPRTPLTGMRANGIGGHHGGTAKAVLTPTLMVLQTLQPVADLNGTLRHGADAWPFDGTQWADSDGDGYGDNGSEGATNPDRFPDNITVPLRIMILMAILDRWTEFYNGSWDDDNDGVSNSKDECGDSNLSTEAGVIDELGCKRPSCRNQTGGPTTNGGGLLLDGCPDTWGNSTDPYPGCPDTDGDGFMDSQDEFPLESFTMARF